MSNSLPETIKPIIEALQDKKAENLVVIDVRGLASFTDYFIIATGNNSPHAQTLADAVFKLLKKPNEAGIPIETDLNSSWVLIDGGSFIVHIFQPKAREYYALEELWQDAKKLELN